MKTCLIFIAGMVSVTDAADSSVEYKRLVRVETTAKPNAWVQNQLTFWFQVQRN